MKTLILALLAVFCLASTPSNGSAAGLPWGDVEQEARTRRSQFVTACEGLRFDGRPGKGDRLV